MVQLCRGLQTNTHLEEFRLGLRACTSQMKEVINATLAINLTLKSLLVMPEDFPDARFAPRRADEYTRADDDVDELTAMNTTAEYSGEKYRDNRLLALLDVPYQVVQAREAEANSTPTPTPSLDPSLVG